MSSHNCRMVLHLAAGVSNTIVVLIALPFGLLGVTGGLADVSYEENLAYGSVLLYVALVGLASVVALIRDLENPHSAIWRTAQVLNAGLVALAFLLWCRTVDRAGFLTLPPMETTILLGQALMNLFALHFRSKNRVPKNRVSAGEQGILAATRAGSATTD